MAKTSKAVTVKEESKKKCGIVMPIAGFDKYSEEHWLEVKEIVMQAAEKAGFDANIVSYANESSVIHSNIIQNLYDNEIVVVDVSGKNPNVMFELGIRLAFDKPTIVIKDDETSYSFDTSPLDHLGYLKTLNYNSIILFKEQLTKKIEATYNASQKSTYRSFMKNFREIKIAKLDKKEVGQTEFILKAIEDLRSEIKNMPLQSKRFVSHEAQSFRSAFTYASTLHTLWIEYLKSKLKVADANIDLKDFEEFADWAQLNFPLSSTDINWEKLTPQAISYTILDRGIHS